MQLEEEIERMLEESSPSPVVWAADIAKCIASHGVQLPSTELGQFLVSRLCFTNKIQPFIWKFLHHGLSSRLLSPLHVLSLLTRRVIPYRQSHPEAFRLYVELLRRFALSFDPSIPHTCKHKIVESVNVTLQLSQNFSNQVVELGHAFVLFFFTIITALIDCTLDDWGMRKASSDVQNGAVGTGSVDYQHMDVDPGGACYVESAKHREQMRLENSFLAIEVVGQLTESIRAMALLRLIYLNMPEKFEGLLQRLHLVEVNKLASSSMKSADQNFARLFANIKRIPSFDYPLKKHRFIRMLMDAGSCRPVSCCNFGLDQSACWVPFDIFMENAMDGKQLSVKSAIVLLKETIYTLQIFNKASWKETFLSLWLSALRLVQRERDPLEGPVPHLEARLCILLSIVPLAIADVFDEEAKLHFSSSQESNEDGMGRKGCDATKQGLISALQLLGSFLGLICPPASITAAANTAAAKAAIFVSKDCMDGLDSISPFDTSLNAGGNMRHLIVEACIARNLIDSSAYFWPGYVSSSIISSELKPVKKSPWCSFMEGAPLSGQLVNSLSTTPASSLAEIEKLYHIALSGSAEEKLAAAKILCGASLSNGWNVQEHVVHFIVKLLSPPVPHGYGGPTNHLIDHMPMLSAVLLGASSVDIVHILSLHGVIPEVAAALMPLCETFGSLVPTQCSKSSTIDNPSIYMIFSAAFLFLLRLWKFYKPPLELGMSGGAMGGELTLEYLLLLRNSHIASQNAAAKDETGSNLDRLQFASGKPIYIDYFPKLRAWYCHNRSCIASTLSGLCSGHPVHEVANKILSMIYGKITKSGASQGNSSSPSSSGICRSPSSGEDNHQIPVLPAWDMLEAIPFVLEATLTACACGRLSSRDLTTGLRDLVDFLPASLAVIISYFSAEVTRGIWKLVPMNGTDWPSPAAILPLIESEMKEIFTAAGVNVPSHSLGTSLMLPLPIAALVSLTITFKLTKSLEYILAVVGPALESCASSCPWPSIPIIGSLWAQKIHRWHNFIVVSCSRSVFRHNKEAVAQLLRSCFTSFVGPFCNSTLSTNQSSVNGLLGSVIATAGVCPTIAPGFLYLRSCRTIQDIQYVNDVIVGLVAEYARESAARWTSKDSPSLKSGHSSLSFAAATAGEVARLGASLLCVSGGFQLIQELYRETIPTWLLSSKGQKLGKVSTVACIMEGFAMAYLLMMSGSFAWGVDAKTTSLSSSTSKRGCTIGVHMEFLARVLEGQISLGCNPATLRAYVSCLVGLMVSYAPAWIQLVKVETLRKLGNGLIGWDECELALSLLERGGIPAFGSVAELVNVIN